jgi:hypothetical protein
MRFLHWRAVGGNTSRMDRAAEVPEEYGSFWAEACTVLLTLVAFVEALYPPGQNVWRFVAIASVVGLASIHMYLVNARSRTIHRSKMADQSRQAEHEQRDTIRWDQLQATIAKVQAWGVPDADQVEILKQHALVGKSLSLLDEVTRYLDSHKPVNRPLSPALRALSNRPYDDSGVKRLAIEFNDLYGNRLKELVEEVKRNDIPLLRPEDHYYHCTTYAWMPDAISDLQRACKQLSDKVSKTAVLSTTG